MGLDFFRKVVKLQRKHATGRRILNSLQTNGTRLDDEWCSFLSRQRFLVGLSLDGSEHIPDSSLDGPKLFPWKKLQTKLFMMIWKQLR